MARYILRWPTLLVLSVLLVAACGGPANRGFPSTAGEYPLQSRSVAFDGKDYTFAWTAPDGAIHQAKGSDIKLVQDERSYVAVGQGPPVLHLAADEPIGVRGRDQQGSFSSWWFPFFVGYAMGGPSWTQPSYRYPPTDTFSRGDTLHGNEATSRPAPPDYSKVKPAPNAVSGQGGGTGAGTGASNRDAGAAVSGQSGGAGAGAAASDRGAAVSGQAGGAGSGTAASDRGAAVSGQSGGTGAGDAASDKGRTGRDGGVQAAPAAPAAGAGAPSAPSSSGSRGGARSGGRR